MMAGVRGTFHLNVRRRYFGLSIHYGPGIEDYFSFELSLEGLAFPSAFSPRSTVALCKVEALVTPTGAAGNPFFTNRMSEPRTHTEPYRSSFYAVKYFFKNWRLLEY